MNLTYRTEGRHLSGPEFDAVSILLNASALSFCVGVDDRIDLTGRTLIVESLDTWRWSSGEELLLQVLLHLLGEESMPCDLSHLDEPNQIVVGQALALLHGGRAQQHEQLLAAVESTGGAS